MAHFHTHDGFEPWLDSVLPRECAGCRRPGRSWCASCSESLRGYRPALCEPSIGGPPLLAVLGEHVGLLRAAVLLHKSRRHNRVRADLTALAAAAVTLAVDALTALTRHRGAVLLVPVPPSSPSAWRSPAGEVAIALSAASATISASPLIAARRRRAQQKTLDAAGRAENVAGAFRLQVPALLSSSTVVLLDDVVTTGATLAAVSDLLRRAGFLVPAAVAFSRTPKGQ